MRTFRVLAILGVLSVGAASAIRPSDAQVPGEVAKRTGVVVADRCPRSGLNTDDPVLAPFGPSLVDHPELYGTLGAVQEYIKPELGPSMGTRLATQDLANPSAQFGTAGMAGTPRTVVFLEVVGDRSVLERHADALATRVPRPDRLLLCPTRSSEATRRRITSELMATYGNGRNPSFYIANERSYDSQDDRITVRLRGDGVSLAETIRQQYGDEVRIIVGNLNWPEQTLTADAASECGSFTPTTAPVEWKLPRTLRVASGQTTTVRFGTRTLKRTAPPIPHGVMRAIVVDSRTNQVVAARSGVGYPAVLQHVFRVWSDHQASVSTDSCVPSLGYSIPPGRYRVYLVEARGSKQKPLISPPIPLTVVAA